MLIKSHLLKLTRLYKFIVIFLVCLSFIFQSGAMSWASGNGMDSDIQYLKKLSIEDLLNIEVTSVSKKTEKVFNAPAAAFVITSEDIRRSGVTSIPEALRMAPGLQVGRINANSWMITARGFSGVFANKLLVLIDGRSVYSPLFSGVFWDVQDLLLEDVDRIEVIRGPGATLWGANAVNGIINIITKPAVETQNSLVSAGIGTEERAFGGARFGAKISDTAHFRVYAKYFNRDEGQNALGLQANDDWNALRGGFRLDWQESDFDTITIQGDIYESDAGMTLTNATFIPPYTESVTGENESNGGNLLTRWEHKLSQTSEIALRLFYDYTHIDQPLLEEDRDTFDIDFQHRFELTERNEVTWGMGYRNTDDDIVSGLLTVIPESVRMERFSAFVQDRITLWDDTIWLTLGSKFEKNEFTDLEVQPSGRLLIKPDEAHTLWASVSRAVRTPSRGERGFQYNTSVQAPGSPRNPGQLPMVIQIRGNEDMVPEEVLAYEIGYRVRAANALFFDLTAYYNDYDKVASDRGDQPEMVFEPTPHIVLPLNAENEDSAKTYGFELATDWQPSEWWQLKGSYTWWKAERKLDIEGLVGSSPRNQFSLRSAINLPYEIKWDLWLRYVDNLPELSVDAYMTLDTRLAWWPTAAWELSIVGQNLFEPSHLENDPPSWPIVPTEVERSVYIKATWYY